MSDKGDWMMREVLPLMDEQERETLGQDARDMLASNRIGPKLGLSDARIDGNPEWGPGTLDEVQKLRAECLRIAVKQAGDPLLRARDLFDFVMTGKT